MWLRLRAAVTSRTLTWAIVTAVAGCGAFATVVSAQAPGPTPPSAPAPVAQTPVAQAPTPQAPTTQVPTSQVPTSQSPATLLAAPAFNRADLELIQQLRAGGLAIVTRHAPADPNKADISPLDFKAIRNQQPLTEAGRVAARTFGEALRTIGVPIAEVLTSRFHRAVQTAQIAGFKNSRAVTELTEGSLVTSVNEQRRRASALKQLLAAPLPPGTNRLLITHRMNMMQAFGKEWFEVKEGEASVFRIDNGAYSLVARLQIQDWNRLAAIVQPPQN